MMRKGEDMVTAMVTDQLSELLSRGYDRVHLGNYFNLNKVAGQIYNSSKSALQAGGNVPVMFKVNFMGRIHNSIAIVNLVYRWKPAEQQLTLFSFSASIGNKARKSIIVQPDDIPSVGSLKKWIYSEPNLGNARKNDSKKPGL